MIFGKHINKYYLKYCYFFLFGIVALVMVDYAQLEIPKYYRMLLTGINTGFIDDNKTIEFVLEALLNYICGPIVIIAMSMIFGRFLWRICFFGVALYTESDIRKEMFTKAESLSQYFYQTNKVGDLMSLFTNDLGTVQECMGWGVMMFCDAAFLGILALIRMFTVDPILSTFSLIPMVIGLIISLIVSKYMTIKWDSRQEAFSKISDFSQESFSGISVIKAFVKEAKELFLFKKLNINNENKNVEYVKLSALMRVLTTLFVESVICIILGYGGYLVYTDVLTAERLVEFIGYFTAIVWPIMAISELIELHSKGKASLNRISRLLETKPDIVDNENAIDMGKALGDIEIKNLDFKYPDVNEYALKNVSVKINHGEKVGIVGKTGSGKTTLIDLLLRIYNVDDGRIFIDGKDINKVTLSSLRKNIAYVPQDNFLFSETISSNISFSLEENDIKKVKNAANMAAIADNIEEFKDGYETLLGERGVTVSGGQKQRISIARAFLKEASILILDDSVSAVDTKTEKHILDNLSNSEMSRTILLIAHRISTIEKMDKIILIDDGKIIGVGTHNELLNSCEEYAKMVELQRLEEMEDKKNV